MSKYCQFTPYSAPGISKFNEISKHNLLKYQNMTLETQNQSLFDKENKCLNVSQSYLYDCVNFAATLSNKLWFWFLRSYFDTLKGCFHLFH